METIVKSENFEVEQRMNNFLRAFTGLMKCHNMNMGIDLKKKELVVQDKETLKIASIGLETLNKLTDDDDNDRNDKIAIPVATKLIDVSRNNMKVKLSQDVQAKVNEGYLQLKTAIQKTAQGVRSK